MYRAIHFHFYVHTNYLLKGRRAIVWFIGKRYNGDRFLYGLPEQGGCMETEYLREQESESAGARGFSQLVNGMNVYRVRGGSAKGQKCGQGL